MSSRKQANTQQLIITILLAGFGVTLTPAVMAQSTSEYQGQNHQGNQERDMKMMEAQPIEPSSNAQTLPPVPTNLPKWMDNKDRNHIYRKRGVYNDAIYNVRPLALDLNAVAVGHAFAYEDIVTGKAKDLETKTFEKINWVLKNPPRFMPDEANISSTFGRKYGVLEQVFDWAHVFHAQTVDVLASTKMTDAEKEAEIERLYQFYIDNVPYAITGLPMNMGYLDSQPYSKAFRQKYPKVNGLFWGYHWLQGTMYDTLYGKNLEEQRTAYAEIGKRYHEVELYRTDRPFMPMFAEVSPRFAKRFPQISNTFDNLHMLHDVVNDVLASDWMTEEQKEGQIKRAIWMVMAANHKGMKPGEKYGDNGLHDHRFMEGMPGMGMMPEGLMNHGNMNHGGMPMNENTMPMNNTQDAPNNGTMNHGEMQQNNTATPDVNNAPMGDHNMMNH
jgi:hypothetical protein